MNKIEQLRDFVLEIGTSPVLSQMERRGLREKGIDGPTGAHVIEEIHAPLNFAYITATTGSSAFQNLVGVTWNEIPDREMAAQKLFELTSIQEGCRMLVTYPPLVSVFSKAALEVLHVEVEFMLRSERAAFILAVCEKQPDVIVGESSFLKAALNDARRMEMLDLFPEGLVFLAAGTPLDMELLEAVKDLPGGRVHDLYGCQEFGFLTLDGIPLRDDLSLLERKAGYFDLFVGGLPTGDCFAVSEKGHVCNSDGKIITYSRIRQNTECEVWVQRVTAGSLDTARRLVKTILRIKAKIVRLAPDVELGAECTQLVIENGEGNQMTLDGPVKTRLFDRLLNAQKEYQAMEKTDPAWSKMR